MGKNFKHLFMFVILFTTLGFFYNCSDNNENQPPAAPTNPSPANNKDSVSPAVTFSWSACIDPENDSVKYDIYLGTSTPPVLVKSNSLLNSYTPDTLNALTKYYWKVVAKDNKNNFASSPIWSFKTGEPILPPGDLDVFFCDATGTNYFGGADVYLYRSYSERFNDNSRTNYFSKASTDNTDPFHTGAIFYALTYQKYYIACSWSNGTVTFTGEGECFVPKSQTTKLVIHAQ